MGMTERQRTDLPFEAADVVSDRKQNSVTFYSDNTRNLTSLLGVITQTSPGVLQSLSGSGTVSNTSPLQLPPYAVPVQFIIQGKLGAATANATIQIGLDTTTNYFLQTSVSNVGGGGSGQLIPRETAQLYTALAALPSGQAHTVTGFYAEAGTSGSGGPWYVEIDFYVASPN